MKKNKILVIIIIIAMIAILLITILLFRKMFMESYTEIDNNPITFNFYDENNKKLPIEILYPYYARVKEPLTNLSVFTAIKFGYALGIYKIGGIITFNNYPFEYDGNLKDTPEYKQLPICTRINSKGIKETYRTFDILLKVR